MALGDEITYFNTTASEIFYGTGEDIAAYILFINLKGQEKQHYKQIILDKGKVNPDKLPQGKFKTLYEKAMGNGFRLGSNQIPGKNTGYAINQYNEFMGKYSRQGPNTQILSVPKKQSDVAINQQLYNQNVQGNPKAKHFGDMVQAEDILEMSTDDPSLGKAGMNGLTAMVNNLAIRRSCKYGLEYFTARQGVVHYCLDRIDNATAAEGKGIVLGNGANKYTICNSELRFLFRNWAQFRRKAFTTANAQGFTRYAQIRFYRGFKEVRPLWEDPMTADAWIPYAKHLAAKTIIVLQRMLDQGVRELPHTHILIEPRINHITRAIVGRNDRSVIASFHTIIDYHAIEQFKTAYHVTGTKRHAQFYT